MQAAENRKENKKHYKEHHRASREYYTFLRKALAGTVDPHRISQSLSA